MLTWKILQGISHGKKHTLPRNAESTSSPLTKPLIDQFPFHCIIHKLPDPEWTNQLKTLLSHNPNDVVIDNPDAIERFHNRVSMLEVVSGLKLPLQFQIEVPSQVFIKIPHSPLTVEGLDFLIIGKTLLANDSTGSHHMYLVLESKGLGELNLKPLFMLQEFVNHGGVIFKVYVAGRHVRCVKRRSLPDISPEKLGASEKVIPFLQILNVEARYYPSDYESRDAAEMPPSELVDEVADKLKEGLTLSTLT